MPIDIILLAQTILICIIGGFSGNLFSIFIDRCFFDYESEIKANNQILKVILSSLKISLFIGLAALFLCCVDLLFAQASINVRFVANRDFLLAFIQSFSATILCILEKGFKMIATSKNSN